jgi:hypothetical protein
VNLDIVEKYLVEPDLHINAVQNSHAKKAAVILLYGREFRPGSTIKKDFRPSRPKQEYNVILLLLLSLFRLENSKSILGLF